MHDDEAKMAKAFASQGDMAETARNMVVEREQKDWDSEFQRFPRLFQGHESIPGLTWPTTPFNGQMTVWLGKRRVLLHALAPKAVFDRGLPKAFSLADRSWQRSCRLSGKASVLAGNAMLPA